MSLWGYIYIYIYCLSIDSPTWTSVRGHEILSSSLHCQYWRMDSESRGEEWSSGSETRSEASFQLTTNPTNHKYYDCIIRFDFATLEVASDNRVSELSTVDSGHPTPRLRAGWWTHLSTTYRNPYTYRDTVYIYNMNDHIESVCVWGGRASRVLTL